MCVCLYVCVCVCVCVHREKLVKENALLQLRRRQMLTELFNYVYPITEVSEGVGAWQSFHECHECSVYHTCFHDPQMHVSSGVAALCVLTIHVICIVMSFAFALSL